MNKESLTVKLLDLVEGRETPETWWSWWDEHETELMIISALRCLSPSSTWSGISAAGVSSSAE